MERWLRIWSAGLLARVLRQARGRGLTAITAIVAITVVVASALSPVMPLLTSEVEHQCACGMAPGTCGCPACEQRERDRLDSQHRSHVPMLRSSCDDDGHASPPQDALPPFLAREVTTLTAPPHPIVLLPRPAAHTVLSADPFEPPTPPPRAA